ncbi:MULTISPECIES: hypothetical protein [unclassified Microcoleus]|uniref:hypothetical protein n=1 Tax=unclassified Microcoleus TaxID=2642155 RepID=UPI002FD261CB
MSYYFSVLFRSAAVSGTQAGRFHFHENRDFDSCSVKNSYPPQTMIHKPWRHGGSHSLLLLQEHETALPSAFNFAAEYNRTKSLKP